MGAMRNFMVRVGLAEEQDLYYDDPQGFAAEDTQVARVPERTAEPKAQEANVTPLRPHQNGVSLAPAAPETMQRITTIHPRSYNDAKSIGESFRDGVPVILNLSDMSEADAKRMVDFSAGLVFGLRGTIERVTTKVFLLSPEFIEVEGESRTDEGTFYNQS
ncbi:cell division protein SepF [Dermabacter sp. p3-SID358]|uniref:cell division protein SepF n=1 Tax=Dermabacter sp. p3-SID358 TaxID=2916114 RepID=UPI0021A7452E|nr:cell division protein SepF [Dermabacter sp. p3-SID358]MCT1867288.1 cell division protein SepF [Dermabacter sp. p3-SID358]